MVRRLLTLLRRARRLFTPLTGGLCACIGTVAHLFCLIGVTLHGGELLPGLLAFGLRLFELGPAETLNDLRHGEADW